MCADQQDKLRVANWHVAVQIVEALQSRMRELALECMRTMAK